MSIDKSKPLILVVENEVAIRDMIRFSLSAAGFVMQDAHDVGQAINHLRRMLPNLILIDWMLPEKSGIEFVHWLKKQKDYQHISIIMLTARAEEENKVRGLEAGADDYMTKPFSPKELIARIKTVLRRGLLLTPDDYLSVKHLKLDINQHQVTVFNQEVKLTVTEFKLLKFFLMHQNKTYSRDRLMTNIWGYDCYIDERTVDVQVRRLRDKLKPFGCDAWIKTIRGVGYQFDAVAIETAEVVSG